MTEAAAGVVAAVDCGTNSTRMLIAEVGDAGVTPLVRRAAITRLGAGVDATGRVSDDAIARVVDVLERYASEWTGAGARHVAVTATSAARDAVNADDFSDAARRATGVAPMVLTGGQEAALMFQGAAGAGPGRHVVCDIGGGSTELVVGDRIVQHWVSLPLGGVRLRERYLLHDPPTRREYAALIADIDATLDTQPNVYNVSDGHPLIAVAGTALTSAAVAVGSVSADVDVADGTVVSVAQLAQVVEELAWLPVRERLRYPPIVPGRGDVIVAGALLLIGIADRFGFDAVQARVADLLDGVVTQLAVGTWPPGSSTAGAA